LTLPLFCLWRGERGLIRTRARRVAKRSRKPRVCSDTRLNSIRATRCESLTRYPPKVALARSSVFVVTSSAATRSSVVAVFSGSVVKRCRGTHSISSWVFIGPRLEGRDSYCNAINRLISSHLFLSHLMPSHTAAAAAAAEKTAAAALALRGKDGEDEGMKDQSKKEKPVLLRMGLILRHAQRWDQRAESFTGSSYLCFPSPICAAAIASILKCG
jgi:hypothetical protein